MFKEFSETDIEHIVARSEAHDSGLCAASPERRREFARDIRNLTLSAPHLNRKPEGGERCGVLEAGREQVLVCVACCRRSEDL